VCQGGVVFLFCICMHEFSQFGFNDETWLNVRLTRYLEKGTIGCRNVGEKCFVGTKYLFSSFKQTYTFEVPSMAIRVEESVWNKKRQKAQPYINKIRSLLEKKTRWIEQVGFLRRCRKEDLMPKGLRVRLPSSIEKSEYGQRLKGRSENKVIKRAVSDFYIC